MPSPDVTPYVDLKLFDKTIAQIYAEAVEYAKAALPEFSPTVGTIEDAVLQAVAHMTGEVSAAINRVPAGVLEILLQLFQITRNSGTAATGVVTITVLDGSGYTIPAGTRFAYSDVSDINNPVLYTFDTDTTLVIPEGNTTGSVSVSGVLNVQYPALQAGQSLRLLTPMSSILLVQLSSNLSVGTEPETDAEYFARAIAKINSYSDALVKDYQFASYVLANYADVYRCAAFDRVNPTNDELLDPLANGYLTIYASKVNGVPLPLLSKQAIEADLEMRAVAGLQITVKDPYLVNVPISATVTMKPGYYAGDIILAVEDALNLYVNPNYWDWSTTIFYNEVIALIDRVEGVDRVVSLEINNVEDDYQFANYGTLPTGVLSISVT